MKFYISCALIGCGLVFGFVSCVSNNFVHPIDDDTDAVAGMSGNGGQGGADSAFDEKHDFEGN